MGSKHRRQGIPLNLIQLTIAGIIGSTSEFVRALKTAKTASNSPSPVLIYRETGVGKELFA